MARGDIGCYLASIGIVVRFEFIEDAVCGGAANLIEEQLKTADASNAPRLNGTSLRPAALSANTRAYMKKRVVTARRDVKDVRDGSTGAVTPADHDHKANFTVLSQADFIMRLDSSGCRCSNAGRIVGSFKSSA
ncbi:hypothetical protein FVF58_46405 [Paraburkholderia panacisoli]|uniref:Uncharacterized protein n=1 Tax=Paraburkholderia panacisoli TaxID=2603818 RepID=A0A5B0G5V9_9BURK|nr:hypothetical protein [Paraburkholderia panacisoli]KAA0998045.1 hypothetical protein FVF58_46405 [Paraburkholderia panacisoli]